MGPLSPRKPGSARHFRTSKSAQPAHASSRCTLRRMTTVKARDDFVEHVVDTMRELGAVSAKPMFGGWGLYHDGLFFALVFEDSLYLKVDDENRAEFEAAGLAAFVYVTKDGDRMTMSYHQ